MKIITVLLAVTAFQLAHAQSVIVSAADVCLKSASSWALKSEAKQTKTMLDKIKESEKRSLGSGANLYLMTVFVEGPNTGDNTHWEIVGEFNLKNSSCKILLGRRYWAH